MKSVRPSNGNFVLLRGKNFSNIIRTFTVKRAIFLLK